MVQQGIENRKKVTIDFLYLDLSTCERCMETETNLDDVVQELSVPCRTFDHEGVTYNDPPKAMIMNGILAVLYGNSPVENLFVGTSKEYVMPENIKDFYEGIEKNSSSCGCGGGSCC